MKENLPEIKRNTFSEHVADGAKKKKPRLQPTLKASHQGSSCPLIIALLSLIDPVLGNTRVVALAADLSLKLKDLCERWKGAPKVKQITSKKEGYGICISLTTWLFAMRRTQGVDICMWIGSHKRHSSKDHRKLCNTSKSLRATLQSCISRGTSW